MNVLGRAALLCVLLGSTSIFLANARRSEAPVARAAFSSFPMQLASWQATNDPPIDAQLLKVLGVDDYLSRVYREPGGAAVGLYMGFYDSQRQGDTIHSPLNCLPGAGWEPVREGRLTIANADGAGTAITVNRYVVRKGLESLMVLYWYQGRGRVIASEYWSKLFLIHDAMRENRTDGALVRVIAPIDVRADDDGVAAERLAETFVRVLYPALPAYLPN
jgi:EpsI family protein